MKNNSGFTLVELLAVIIILGILANTAIFISTRQLQKSRQRAYDQIANSAYDAAQNYVISCQLDTNVLLDKYSLKQDISLEFLTYDGKLEEPIDPLTTNSNCTGIVKVKVAELGYTKTQDEEDMDEYNALDSYTYRICLKCSNYKGVYTFPRETEDLWCNDSSCVVDEEHKTRNIAYDICTEQDYNFGDWKTLKEIKQTQPEDREDYTCRINDYSQLEKDRKGI